LLKPYAISLTRDTENAKDLYQETILKALLNRDKYAFGTNLKAWLYTIMRNIFINNYRKQKRFSQIHTETPLDVLAGDRGEIAHTNGWKQLRMREIQSAIESLPDIFRIAFELHYTGYKYHEVASLLNEPLGTIKSRIHFARKILTSKIER